MELASSYSSSYLTIKTIKIGRAFTAGLRNAYLAMAGLLFLAMLLSAFKFAVTIESDAEPEPVAETAPGD